MNRSHNDNDSRLTLSTDALAPEALAEQTTSRPTAKKHRALPLGTLVQEEAARTFAIERDEASFKVLYASALKPMTAVVRRVGLYSYEVHEVVAIARDTIWNLRKHYKGETYGHFVVYAVAAARREALERREEEEGVPVVVRASEEFFGEEAIDPERSPEDVADALEAYGRLSPEEQTVVRMRADGCTHREIGVAIGGDSESVRRIYQRAMERMQGM